MTAQNDTFIAGAGLEIAVRDYGGHGSPILLLHGAGCSLAHWLLMAPSLAKQHHVVAMDFRGHGQSEAGPWTLDLLMGDIEAVHRHFDFSKLAVVGHSMGGVLGTFYAARNPGVVAVVNLDGPSLTPSEYVGLKPADVVERRRRHEAEIAEMPSPPVDIEAQSQIYVNHLGLDITQAGEIVSRAYRKNAATRHVEGDEKQTDTGIDWLYRDFLEEHSLFDLIKMEACRTLFFQAGKIPAFTDLDFWKKELFSAYFAGVDQKLSEIRTSKNILVEKVDATHALLLEIPEDLVTRISDFLQECE
ncbi:MAG: alpha/beta fold hydrolase [Janthinobacterium lividum]